MFSSHLRATMARSFASARVCEIADPPVLSSCSTRSAWRREPTAGMAPRERNDLIALVKRLVVERNISVLFTEHSMDVVFAYADRIIVLARGALIAEGNAEAIRDNARVQEVYLGTGRTFAPH